jgi:YVTN family beta-propeller protein
VFVTNYLDNSVSVIDTRTQKLIATIPVGVNPRGIATTPSGDAIYVTNVGEGTVSIIDSATLTVINTITVGAIPWQIIITPDGTMAFVSNSMSGTVSVIDTASDKVIKTIVGVGPKPAALGLVSNPDKLYVTQFLAQLRAGGIEGRDDGKDGRVTVIAAAR